MKNSSACTALAAFVSFVGAAVYAALFNAEILPSGNIFAVTGIIIALTVLTVLTVCTFCCRCSEIQSFHRSAGCFGKWLAVAAVALLCVSAFLLTLPAAVTMLYTAVLFLAVFFWKFTLILWGLCLVYAVPSRCYMDENSCSCANTAENSCYTANSYRY